MSDLGLLREALSELEAAAWRELVRPWERETLGLAYEQKGDLGAAAANYRRALDLNPHGESAKHRLQLLGAPK
jgi:predicted TPR repeat methyltransferase